jgi:hypothetical protein
VQALIYDGEKKQFGAVFYPSSLPLTHQYYLFPENGSEEERLLNSKEDLKKNSSPIGADS